MDTASALAAIDIIALCTAIGALACLIWITPCSAGDLREQRTRSIWRLFNVCLTLLTLDSVGLLLIRSHVLSEEPYSALAPVLPEVLSSTHYGHVWLLRVLSICALWIMWGVARSRPYRGTWPWLLLAIIAVTAFTRSATSHSADRGDFTPHEITDWLHILAASMWGGGIVASVLTLFRHNGEGNVIPADFNALAYCLSRMATIALPMVLVTGGYNAWKQFTDIAQLWQTDYGRHFLVKITLVTVMLGMGAVNRFFYLNKLPRPSPGRHPAIALNAPFSEYSSSAQSFRRLLYVEAAVALGVFIAVAIMVNTAPPHAVMSSMKM